MVVEIGTLVAAVDTDAFVLTVKIGTLVEAAELGALWAAVEIGTLPAVVVGGVLMVAVDMIEFTAAVVAGALVVAGGKNFSRNTAATTKKTRCSIGQQCVEKNVRRRRGGFKKNVVLRRLCYSSLSETATAIAE